MLQVFVELHVNTSETLLLVTITNIVYSCQLRKIQISLEFLTNQRTRISNRYRHFTSQTFSSLVSLQVKNVTKGFDSVKMHSDSVIVSLKRF